MWLWTCRPGFALDLVEELRRAGSTPHGQDARASLVRSDGRPPEWPVFARAGFPLAAETAAEPEAIAAALAAALDGIFAGARPRAWLLQAWVPDADETNPLAPRALALGERATRVLAATRPELDLCRVEEVCDPLRYGGVLGQVCLPAADRVLIGALAAQDAPTLAAGGRARSRMPRDAPSRAARKLVEALDWIGRGPEPGELAVDLGAAPGGWTAVLLERRARVVAVDPGPLAAHLRRRANVRHVRGSAFDYAPEEPVDWLCCDMAHRPLEVAALLAKWGRRRWASALVANIKLPMRKRVEFVRRICQIVAEGGWRDLRARQLYHDREEFTLAAWRS